MTTPPPYGDGYPPPGDPQPGYPQPGYPPQHPSPGAIQPYSPYPVSGGPYPYPPTSAPPQQPYSPYPTGYAPMRYAPMGYAPMAPMSYGYDPVTGQPFSDKSKIAAGLLQLLPGAILALGGIGRLYAGHVGLGVAQLLLSLVGWVAFWCGFALFFVPWLVFVGLWIWFVVDGVVMLAGRPVDGQGRPLRS